VFSYKFDTHSFLTKFKARLCVRGDRQPCNELDTYAATLAGTTFRVLMAICAKFDLETRQFDAVNAFTNSDLDETIYCEMPKGFKRRGWCWKLLKALYGLRRSPLLWYRELSSKLKELGLEPIYEDACVFHDGKILVFFYVDDIIVMFRKESQARFEQVKRGLFQAYEMKDLGELKWFLGIQIIRDRLNRKLWLCQSAYIEKIAARFHLQGIGRTRADIPMKTNNLVKYEGEASANSVEFYQSKVGSVQYPATITRADVARTTTKLAEFLLNPGPVHHEAADQCIRYLHNTKNLAICYSGSADDALICMSDASFADHVSDRKSSQGYVMKLFGGLILWKAGKQNTVTTSSTEAELLALTNCAKELIALDRLLTQIQLRLDGPLVLKCDNNQTIRLLTAEYAKLFTKLRHVDVHHHWLRQEVQRQALQVGWVPTSEMIADGLTKALPRQRFERFVDQLGLVDVTGIIQAQEETDDS